MKKILILLSTLLLINGVLTGCSNNSNDDTDNNSENIGNSSGQQQVVNLNPTEEDAKWNDTIEKFYEEGLDSTKYPCSRELYVMANESSKLIDFTIVIQNDTTDEEGLEYTTQMVKLFNDLAMQDDSSITPSSDGYYGSLFDEYNINLTVASEETAMYESQWLVCQNIQAGTHEAVKKGGYVAS